MLFVIVLVCNKFMYSGIENKTPPCKTSFVLFVFVLIWLGKTVLSVETFSMSTWAESFVQMQHCIRSTTNSVQHFSAYIIYN